MAKKKKKAAKAAPAPPSDKSYIAHGRARSLPLYKCLINEGWQESGMAEIFVLRKHANDHITAGMYLVDTFCTGVKSTFYLFNTPEYEFEERVMRAPADMEECSYELAHNIIYGALAYAREYGIEPDPDFNLTQKILEEDTEDIELIELEFGRNGKPALLINPAGDPRADYYLRQLEKYAGPGNYDVVDGRLGDDVAFGDESEEDLEDDFYTFPEEWDEWDWEDFIDETEPEELVNYLEVASYMYHKTVAAPTQAVKLLTAQTEHVGMAIAYEPLPNAFSAEEMNEAADVLGTLKKAAADPERLLDLEDMIGSEDADDDLLDTDKILDLLKPKGPSEEVLRQGVERLQQDIAKWPKNPIFRNYLAILYRRLGEDEQADNVTRELHEQFPEYLHGKIMYAEMLIHQGKAEEVPAVFNGEYNLKGVYPERDTFHISELTAFNTVMADYFYEIGDLYMAHLYLHMLDQMQIPENVSLNLLLILKINIAIAQEMEPVLQEARQSEEKTQELIAQLMG